MPGHLFPNDKEKAGPAIEERLPDGFVMLAWLLPDAVTDMRYAGSCNFMGTPVEGYEAPAAILTLEAAAALKKADDRLKARGFRIKVLDAYRPPACGKTFSPVESGPSGYGNENAILSGTGEIPAHCRTLYCPQLQSQPGLYRRWYSF